MTPFRAKKPLILSTVKATSVECKKFWTVTREMKFSNLSKEQWKIQIKNAVKKYLTEHLQSEAKEKSTPKYL